MKDPRLDKYGLDGVNKPKRTPKHATNKLSGSYWSNKVKW